ncbi:MAG TPA: hypothetical protein VES65_11280 [Solirubrobacteraceae bacterium]|nr:hypothetical protein [Solirubrobacteraceae bacterium]
MKVPTDAQALTDLIGAKTLERDALVAAAPLTAVDAGSFASTRDGRRIGELNAEITQLTAALAGGIQ